MKLKMIFIPLDRVLTANLDVIAGCNNFKPPATDEFLTPNYTNKTNVFPFKGQCISAGPSF